MKKIFCLFLITLTTSCFVLYHPPKRKEFEFSKVVLCDNDFIRKDGFYVLDTRKDTVWENNLSVRIYRVMVFLENNEFMESFEIWAKSPKDAMDLFNNYDIKGKRTWRNTPYGLYQSIDTNYLKIETVFPDRPVLRNFFSFQEVKVDTNKITLTKNTYYNHRRKKPKVEKLNMVYFFHPYEYKSKSVFD